MKNPQFGVWAKDDEEVSDAQTGEPVDERAAQALALVEDMKAKTALSLYEDKRPRQRIAVTSQSAPLPLPPTGIYSRPLTFKEAEMLLKSAGIDFSNISSTYVADSGIIDHNTARVLYPRAQCVVAELPADLVVERKGGERIVAERAALATVHLLFVWGKRGWKLVKAMVEKKFCL